MYIAIVVEGGERFYRMKIADKDEFCWVRERNLAHKYSTPDEAIFSAIDSLPEDMKYNVSIEPV